ncbi:MAG TPA: hypothetical protein VNR17_10145 [Luteimicrobium sp.]|nr:hypothetical protein [Luteimicrobium sp.]
MPTNILNVLPPQDVADLLGKLTVKGLRLGTLVQRYDSKTFLSGRGRTAYLPVHSALIARDRDLDEVTAAVVVDQLNEKSEPISLETHAISVTGLSEGELSLDLQNFSNQVLMPQSDAVVDRAEEAVARVLNGASVSPISWNPDAPLKTFSAARAELRRRGVDVAAANLVCVAGGNVADALLDSGVLDFDKTGSADALRNGTPGSVRGFEIVESGRVDDDALHFFVREGVYLATRAPELPQSAKGGISNEDSVELRWISDYDADHTRDRSVVSTFLGAGLAPLYKITRDYTAGTVAHEKVTGGALVSVDTSAA